MKHDIALVCHALQLSNKTRANNTALLVTCSTGADAETAVAAVLVKCLAVDMHNTNLLRRVALSKAMEVLPSGCPCLLQLHEGNNSLSLP